MSELAYRPVALHDKEIGLGLCIARGGGGGKGGKPVFPEFLAPRSGAMDPPSLSRVGRGSLVFQKSLFEM